MKVRIVLLGLICGWFATASVDAEIHRLAAWRFDSPEGAAEDGSLPRSRGGVPVANGAVGSAVEFRTAGTPLLYPLPRGTARSVDPLAMSLGFYYRPFWTSPGGERKGNGPGEIVRLVSIGDSATRPEEGWWELSVSADGSRLLVSYGNNSRERVDVSSRPCGFEQGRWTYIQLSLLPGRIRVFCDNDRVVTEAPRSLGRWRGDAIRRGICFGSTLRGDQPALGVLDEVEIHDGPLEEIEVFKRGRVMRARSVEEGRGLELRWRSRASAPMELQRSVAGSSNWVSLASRTGLVSHVDRAIRPGELYIYRVLTNDKPSELNLFGGVRLPPREDRGLVLLLVDRTLADSLAPDLDRWERDAVADGWTVHRHAVPRHDDQTWSNNTNAIASVRDLVRSEWETSGKRVRCLFLVGHVVIPYSGMYAEDHHMRSGDNHVGAWPSDQYYGDVDGIWTDTEPYPKSIPEATHAATRNVPGDGKFDTLWVPPNAEGDTRLEIPFGRVDFSNMPVFGGGANREVELIRGYLDKVHRYREGRIPAQPRTVFGTYWASGIDLELMPAAYRTGSRLFGYEPWDLFQGDLFQMGIETAVWGFQSGGGKIDRIRDGLPSMVTSAHVASGMREPRVLFAMLLGSWFGDWAVGQDNLLRSIIGSRDYGLAAIWVRLTEWRFDVLARGGTLAEAQLETANEAVECLNPSRGTTRTLTILGDPTLRLHHTPPPVRLRGARGPEGVRLRWRPDRALVSPSFWVYRGGPGRDAPWVRLTESPLQVSEFVDANPPAGARYQVKALQIIETASGSYTNLSSGAAWPAADP